MKNGDGRAEGGQLATLFMIEQMGEQMPGGFFIYHAEGEEELLYANDVLLDIFGCDTLEEFKALTGYTFKGLVHPEDIDKVEESILEQIAESEKRLDYVEYRIIRKDGEVRWVDDYGRRVNTEDYGEVYYVFIRDITELHILRDKQHANEIRSAFLDSMSDEIRTPMNSILGFTELASRHMYEPILLAEFLGKIRDSGRQLLTLFDNVLEMSNLSFGRISLSPEKTVLRDELIRVVDSWREMAEGKNLILKEEFSLPEDRVLLDVHCFRQIIGNLLDNAIRFTPMGGTIKLSACLKGLSASGKAEYEVIIADTGRGISEAFQEKLFEPFEKEDPSSGSAGIGLGLAITKGLLEAMEGSITLNSRPGEGTEVKVLFPLADG